MSHFLSYLLHNIYSAKLNTNKKDNRYKPSEGKDGDYLPLGGSRLAEDKTRGRLKDYEIAAKLNKMLLIYHKL